jgi:hypothetical protein
MNQENSREKEEKKILVEFIVPDDWNEVVEDFFSRYLPDNVADLDESDIDFLASGKIVTPCESKEYDTIP